jgi:FMN phosphatase YigB (HAD superfamily)
MAFPRVIVFDLGKVLVEFDYQIAANRLAARCAATAHQLNELINQSPLLFQYETGQMTTGDFIAESIRRSGFRGTPEEFGSLFADIFTPVGPMVELHARLRRRGFRTYIFSNTNELAVRHLRRHFAFFSQFDGYIFSYEHRATKPSFRLYEVLERQAAARGADLLYLDDRPENIATGAARGWQVLLHQTPEQTQTALQPLL